MLLSRIQECSYSPGYLALDPLVPAPILPPSHFNPTHLALPHFRPTHSLAPPLKLIKGWYLLHAVCLLGEFIRKSLVFTSLVRRGLGQILPSVAVLQGFGWGRTCWVKKPEVQLSNFFFRYDLEQQPMWASRHIHSLCVNVRP